MRLDEAGWQDRHWIDPPPARVITARQIGWAWAIVTIALLVVALITLASML